MKVFFARAAALLLVLTPVRAWALQLLCEGQTFVPGKEEGMTNDFPFIMDDATHVARVWTLGGTATGKFYVSDASYSGVVVDPAGIKHSVTLDRYTGKLFIIATASVLTGGKPEFMGKCSPAKPQF